MIWLWIWGIVTAISLVVEFLTADLITIWFAAGGLVTLLVVALADISLIWQLVIFVGVSVGLLLCTRKICLKLLRNDGVKTNTDALIGTKFILEDVQGEYAYHKFNGISWRICAINGESLQAGIEFEICDIKGNRLIVKKTDKK